MLARPPQAITIQLALDSARGGVAPGRDRAALNLEAETSLAELKACRQASVEFIQSLDPAAFAGAEPRELVSKCPNCDGYSFITGPLNCSAERPVPRHYGRVDYADFPAHLGPPEILAAA